MNDDKIKIVHFLFLLFVLVCLDVLQNFSVCASVCLFVGVCMPLSVGVSASNSVCLYIYI